MLHLDFNNTSFRTALLIKETNLVNSRIVSEYFPVFKEHGVNTDELVAFGLPYDKKKPSAALRKSVLEDHLLPELERLGITDIIIADGEYFKTLCKTTKAEVNIGYVLQGKFPKTEHLNVTYISNYASYFYNPDNADKTKLSLKAFQTFQQGKYVELGTDVLKDVYYPETLSQIKEALTELLSYPALTMDIEAYHLKHHSSGIGTISFSKDEYSAIAFAVDTVPCKPYEIDIWDKKDKKFKRHTAHNVCLDNPEVKCLLRWFFDKYTGTHIWHNATYDLYILVYELYMTDLTDREGMLKGLEILLKNFECSQIITYLATNSCAGNHLGLKAQAHEFVGNYAIDVKDIRLQKVPDLLKYNAIDTCATWFTMDKNYLQMVLDDQLEIYLETFKPCVIDIIEMQLTGLCLDEKKVDHAENYLKNIGQKAIKNILSKDIVQRYIYEKRLKEVDERNASYKKKVITLVDTEFVFNPNSNLQLQELLYDYMELPVIDFTDTKQPATGGKTLEKLINHVPNTVLLRLGSQKEEDDFKEILSDLRELAQTTKILTSFITAFKEQSVRCPDGSLRIFGSFKLGGTVSARLSSSNINFQQIPSGSTFAKLIKACCIAPPGFIMAMSDFAALEDVINTLLTKDPAKRKVLLDGFDGHSYRCYSFWEEKFPHINPDDPVSVNSIKDTNDAERNDAKPVHFAMQYWGTWNTLMNNCGFSAEEAQMIEGRYHEMYRVSFDWIDKRITEAAKVGYGIGAFGLKIRAPLLNQVLLGSRSTPHAASAEARTLGNALSGQSYCLLNGRASAEFMRKVRASKYRLDIMLWAQIHDALYLFVRDSFEVIEWVNKHLIDCMAWQELPELVDPDIKVHSELDLAYPSWADAFTIKNGAKAEEIKATCLAEHNKRKVL